MNETETDVTIKCIKCEMEIITVDLEDEAPKKGEYANDISAGCGCVLKGK